MTKVNLSAVSRNSRVLIKLRLEQQIKWEKDQMDHFAARAARAKGEDMHREIANEQYYMGRMHALCNLKWEM